MSGARHAVWGLPLLAAPRASRRNSRGKPGSRVSTVRGAEAAGRGEQLPRAGGCDQGCCLFFHQRRHAWSGH
ncbi:hypothetical protein NDU88_006126 [Pleurodeles waltl]|uniref:Uncharacterized protein n=1 Tax=Pleurodeles waltl TaxID=8319 RepID=A0AAV7RR81_PLEWA|nr:hypothetical protein NDU88_006126 [Pleurodeles waltl]